MPTYSGPKTIPGFGLTPEARRASATSQGYDLPYMMFSPENADMMARMLLAESGAIRNKDGSINRQALQGVADVIRNRIMSKQFPNTVEGVLTQKNQFEPYARGTYKSASVGPGSPDYDLARAIAESTLTGESAPAVGGALNYGNVDTILTSPRASSRTKDAFSVMAQDPNSITFYDARNPNTYQHTFGVLPGAKPVNLGMDGQMPRNEAMNVSPSTGMPQGIIPAGFEDESQRADVASPEGEINWQDAFDVADKYMAAQQAKANTPTQWLQPQIVKPRNQVSNMLPSLQNVRGILG